MANIGTKLMKVFDFAKWTLQNSTKSIIFNIEKILFIFLKIYFYLTLFFVNMFFLD